MKIPNINIVSRKSFFSSLSMFILFYSSNRRERFGKLFPKKIHLLFVCVYIDECVTQKIHLGTFYIGIFFSGKKLIDYRQDQNHFYPK